MFYWVKGDGNRNMYSEWQPQSPHHHKHKPQYVTFTTFSANLQALGWHQSVSFIASGARFYWQWCIQGGGTPPLPPHTVWVKYDEWARLLFYKTLYKMCSKQNKKKKKRNKKEVSTDTPGRVYQQVQNKLDCYCWKSINDKPLGKCGLCVQ